MPLKTIASYEVNRTLPRQSTPRPQRNYHCGMPPRDKERSVCLQARSEWTRDTLNLTQVLIHKANAETYALAYTSSSAR